MTEGKNTFATAPFAVMAKPVGSLCNMRCSYCYYLETQNNQAGPVMQGEILEAYIRQYIEASPGPVVPFTWHGGEPTLAGLDFYKSVVEIQNRYLPTGITCWNNLQTNGLMLNEDWCDFLAGNHFDVGLSIDGAPWIHDEYRKDGKGQGTYERVAAAVRLLQAKGIQPDLLCTVTSSSAKEPLAVYRALRALNTGWVQFIPIVRRQGGGVTPDSVSGAAYGDFLCAIFDEWLYNDLGSTDVQLFAETARVLAGGEASLCWMAPVCGRVVIVEIDGGVYACDHFVAPENRIGTITESHLGALIDLPELVGFGNRKQEGLPGECKLCDWLSLCNGGCPKDRFALATDGTPRLNYLCKGLRKFFSHTALPLKQIIAFKNAGLQPAAMMNRFRAAENQKWKGVGRNDPCPCGSGRKAKHCCLAKRH